MLTQLLGDKIITKPTAQLNMMLLHMVIGLKEINLTALLKQLYIFYSKNKRHCENENDNVQGFYGIWANIDHNNDF